MLVLLASSISAQAEWVSLNKSASSPQAPKVTLLEDNESGTVLKVELSGFEVREVVGADRTYQSIGLLMDAVTTEIGFPELPCVAKILAVPDQAAISIEVIEVGEVHSYTGYVLPPARRSWKEGEPEPPYVERMDAYQADEAYPRQLATVDPPGIFRDLRIVRVAIYPVKYIASRNELRVASSLTIRVKYGAGEVVNPKLTPRRPIAPSFDALYRGIIFNYQDVKERNFSQLGAGRDVILCVTPDASVGSLTPFVVWRNKTGVNVRIVKTSEIGGGTDPNVIKNYISQAYRTWQYPPTYVLLVGDYPTLPVSYTNGVVNEDFYVEIDGIDFLPEMMIGRFTHDNDAGEQVVVNKIVTYERNPYTANTAWFKKGAVVSNSAYVSQAITKRFTRERMLVDGRFTAVDTFINRSPCTSQLTDVVNAINNGRSFLNYRGEGWYTEWWASCYRMGVSNVTSLNNGQMLTFVTSIGCGVGNFTNSGGNCFGETWFELGTVAAPRGAVTFIGPTGNTHTTYNNQMDKGIYIGMFQEGLETPGQALMRGRLYMYEVFGNEYYVQYQTRIYCIIGDPSVHVWKDVPRPVAVVHPSSIGLGYNQVAFTVTDSVTGAPNAGAEVCLAGDSVYSIAFADAHGRVIVPVTPEQVGTLTVLVRGGNVVPYEGSITITSETEHVAPFGEPVVVDLDGNLDGQINPNEHGEITFRLKNWGTQTASSVQATLNVDTSMVQLQTTTPVSFGNLASGGSFTGSPYQFFVKPTCAVGDTIHFALHVTSTTRTWDYVQLEEVKGCKLKSLIYVVDDRGSIRTNGRMDPGETVKLYVKVKNVGEDIAPNVRATLRCASPFISITDSLGTFNTMGMDSSFTNIADYFVVRVDSQCPAQSTIPYSLLLQTQGGRYAYGHTEVISIPVSVPRHGDPTGPDAYGYYAYVSDDTLYRQCPRYDWFELNGIGTQVTGTGSDFTTTVTLPFTFRYYGVDYTQVRLSTDGWIAFGSGTQTLPANYPLPHNDVVNCMVAAFWMDLFASSGETGKLLYYQAPDQRFIIEWYNVGHRASTTKKETFQIILYNPVTYPTPTGDGEILMLYKDTDDPLENTVGLENHTQTIGLQYACEGLFEESSTLLRDSLAILYTTKAPELVLVGVREEQSKRDALPEKFALDQNYPNPFNPQTTVSYALPASSRVILTIYSVTGQLVRTLYDGEQSAGRHVAVWDGANDRGASVGSGVYFCRMQVAPRTEPSVGVVQTKKLLLMK
jgi:hypothetical protein